MMRFYMFNEKFSIQWSPMTGPKVDSPPPSRRELMALARENCSRGSQDRDRETAPIVSNKLMPPLGSGGCPVVGSTKSPRQTEGKVGEHAAASSSASSSALGSSFPSSPRTAPRSRRQKGRGGFRRCRPTSPFASQTDEEEDTCSTQASTSPPEDQDVSSHDSHQSLFSESGEAPLHTDSPNVKKTGASSPVEVAAPNPSASLQGSRLLPGKTTAVEGRKSVPSTDFPEHGIHWPDAPQIVPFVGAETVLDTLITRDDPPGGGWQSALRSATRAYHTLGLPKEPWMTALESTWKEFGRAYAASHWKSCRLEIQQLEDEISALSGEARELQSKAGVARGRRSALEAKHAKDTQTVSQLRQAVETLQDRAQKFAAVVETTAKATPAKQQCRPPPAAGEGEPEAKRSRLPLSSGSAGGHRRVVLNPADCDLDFDVGGNGLQGHALHEEGFAYCWSGARATVGITGGKYCFGCRIISEQKVQMGYTALDQRHLCRLGISRGDDPVGSLGESDHSFGFDGIGKFSTAGKFYNYGAEFGVGDTITCAVNLENRPLASIGYSLNGKWLGIAKQFDAGPKGLGVLNSSPSKLSWECALFPHVLLKNVVVQMYFSIEDGLILEEGYKPWSCALEDGHAIIGPSFPAPKECEVMMMVGLPASGKTRWAEKWVKDHPEKRYVLLGINLALEHMKV
ncbi:hypothetical protein Taro_012543 [Colocasia esculenta]|uniref:SPRY domain-containing protein n=1 Tax=Colocasia esculenta TaxID=4460 RepID=A0A843UDX7_COLES|nr:hypothetical protein [Colocasia esculenta]